MASTIRAKRKRSRFEQWRTISSIDDQRRLLSNVTIFPSRTCEELMPKYSYGLSPSDAVKARKRR